MILWCVTFQCSFVPIGRWLFGRARKKKFVRPRTPSVSIRTASACLRNPCTCMRICACMYVLFSQLALQMRVLGGGAMCQRSEWHIVSPPTHQTTLENREDGQAEKTHGPLSSLIPSDVSLNSQYVCFAVFYILLYYTRNTYEQVVQRISTLRAM